MSEAEMTQESCLLAAGVEEKMGESRLLIISWNWFHWSSAISVLSGKFEF
ncbi:hypothetical protein MKW92_045873 [Papaver armeniacum]|nr:hypothetical protein MKW92_045873 [Papaver armeniacum]